MREKCEQFAVIEILRYLQDYDQQCMFQDVPVAVACFASLILRHTKQIQLVQRAGSILASLAKEYSSDIDIQLISKFVTENNAAIRRISVDEEIQRVLVDSVCEPDMWVNVGDAAQLSEGHGDAAASIVSMRNLDSSLSRLSWPADPKVLDEVALGALATSCRCTASRRMFADFPRVLSGDELHQLFLEPDGVGFSLLSNLKQSMSDHDLLESPARVVLSLSGGVDSMVHLALLWALKNLCGHSFHVACLHLSYPNRDSDVVRSEEEWVKHTCRSLGVPLYGFRNPLRRPHLGEQTGLTREEYEDVSKRFRFKMYECVADKIAFHENIDPAHQWIVMVGHHQDDVDENRLAELGKANLVYIDGVKTMSKCLGVRVFRPLLDVRKHALLQLAEVLPLAYMADSTPKWSRRGWIRRLLDDCVPDKDAFLSLLTKTGDASDRCGDLLDNVVRSWKRDCVVVRETSCPQYPFVVTLDLGPLVDLDLLKTLNAVIMETRHLASDVADVWNPAVADAEKAHLESYTKSEDDMPPSCPVNQISPKITKACAKADEAGGMVVCRAFYSLHDDVRADQLLGGKSLSRKGLLHLWELLRGRDRSRTPYIRGSLHQQVHYTLNPKTNVLVIHLPTHDVTSRNMIEKFTTDFGIEP